ncbi:MAG: hypothetical protein KDK91_27380 [Gammaproteobacteria bacterium]|nr:hypothetical protein [Gammaproteobacteria bacterium]
MSALFGFSGAPAPHWLPAMSAALRHRADVPPELLQSPHGTIGIAGSDDPRASSGSMPMYRDADSALAVAGRVYAAGTRLEPDPKWLLAGFREHGMALWPTLRGQFLIALLDGPNLYLVRDGAGTRSVYYGRYQGRVCFACEPKGVLAVPGFPRRLRMGGLAQYLSFSFVPGESTMLEDLHELPAGHLLCVNADAGIRVQRYFHFEQVASEARRDEDTRSDADWLAEFDARFSAAVRRRIPQDGQALGVFLSGGIDSSAVSAELARQHARPLHTFSIHFGRGYPNELEFARAVADRIGSVHEEVLIEPRGFLPRLRRMIWHLDEPIGDPITMPNYELAMRIPEHIRHVFNGEGGDPVFGGPKNIPMLLQHWYGGLQRPVDFRERAYLASYRRGFEELEHLLTPEARAQICTQRDLVAPLTPFLQPDESTSFLDKLIAANIRLKGAHLILPKVERMLGAARLQPLSPFFDEDLLRLSFEMPGHLRLAHGIEKVVIKQAMRAHLPRAIVERPKSGMRVPVNYWFRGELARYARHILSRRELARAGLFDPARVGRLLRYETLEGPGRHGIRLWMLVTFELWRRIVLEREPV